MCFVWKQHKQNNLRPQSPDIFFNDTLPSTLKSFLRKCSTIFSNLSFSYPANDMEAIGVFQSLITKLPAYGVFCSGNLAAWMVQSYYGAMFSMQTRPEFRRRGYGLHLARKLTQTVHERGYIPYVVIRPENDASKSLYCKLGFKQHFQTVRAIFRPHGYNEELAIPQDIIQWHQTLNFAKLAPIHRQGT